MRNLVLLVACAGCSGGGERHGGSLDMTPAAMCAMPMPEVCDGRDNDCNGKIDDVAAGSGYTAQMVATSILLPKTRTDYAIDVNGDGRLDNQLSSLVAILKSQGTDAN